LSRFFFVFLQKKVEKYIFLTYNIYFNHNAADLADLAPAKFLSGMVLLIVLISAGDMVYLSAGIAAFWFGKGPTLVEEILHLIGGNVAFGVGKLCIQVKRHGLKRLCVAI
jgi:hypothetical protein